MPHWCARVAADRIQNAMSDNDALVAVIDSGWGGFYRSMNLDEVLPGFVKLGHRGDAGAIDNAFEQTTLRGDGVSVKIWGDLKTNPNAEVWKKFAQQFDHPRSVCRFADLAWCADPSDHDSARTAIEAYRQCALPWVLDELDAGPEQWPATRHDGSPVEPEPDERWCFGAYRLRRARQIAIVIGDAKLVDDVTSQTQSLITAQLNNDLGRSACRLFDVVLTPNGKRPAWFAETGLEILEHLGDAPVNWSTQMIDELRTAAAPAGFTGDWAAHLNELHLQALVANANARDELAHWKLLGEAAQFAQDRGMNEQAQALLEQWNAIDPTVFLKKHRFEGPPLPDGFGEQQEEMIQAMTSSIVDPASAIPIIAGPLPATIEELKKQSIRTGLGIPNQTISEGRTSVVADDDELERLDMMNSAGRHALFCADIVLIPALNRIHGKIGLNIADWEAAWKSDFVDDKAAIRLAEATRLFFENRCDTAAHLLCPTLEHMLRRVAWQVRVVEPRPPQPGHDYIPPTLIPILERLEGHIDEQRRQWLQHLLIDSMGFNLRNETAHGTATLVNCQRAALLLNAAAWIASLTIAPPSDEEE